MLLLEFINKTIT